MKFKFVSIRSLLLALLLIAIGLPARAQDRASKPRSSPLALHLEIDKGIRTCPSARLTIIGRLQNNGKQVVVIDKRSLWRFLHFKGPPKDSPPDAKPTFSESLRLSRHLFATGDHFADDDVPTESLVRIDPKKYYIDTLEIPLADEVFFRVPGKYSVKSGYRQFNDWSAKGTSLFIGDVESKELEFEIPNCEKWSNQVSP